MATPFSPLVCILSITAADWGPFTNTEIGKDASLSSSFVGFIKMLYVSPFVNPGIVIGDVILAGLNALNVTPLSILYK